MFGDQQEPTLFTYTTLFRSVVAADHVEVVRQRRVAGLLVVGREPVLGDQRVDVRRVGRADDVVVVLVLEDEDRKSTRLNSSHPSMSYAVFCLKDKLISAVRA